MSVVLNEDELESGGGLKLTPQPSLSHGEGADALEPGGSGSSPTAITDACLRAWKHHLARLTPVERRLFAEHQQRDLDSYAKAINEILMKSKQSSKTSKILNFIKPFFNLSNMYSANLAQAAQADPYPTSVVFGAILCVIQVGTNFLDFQEKVADMLIQMSRKAEVLHQLDSDVYQTDQQVQLALVSVYGDILHFCQEALRLITNDQGQIKTGLKLLGTSAFKNFETKLGGFVKSYNNDVDYLKEKMDLCDKKRNLFAQAHTMHQVSSIRHQQDLNNIQEMSILDQISKRVTNIDDSLGVIRGQDFVDDGRQQEKLRKYVFDWIPGQDFERVQDEKFDLRIEDTGNWLLEHDQYRQWHDNDDSCSIAIEGKPGSGKSILASVVINDICQSLKPGHAIAYLYCNASNSSYEDLVGSIIRQLCRQLGSIPQDLVEMYRDASLWKDGSATWRHLEKSTSSLTSSFTSVAVIIDGLDEVQELKRTVKFLKTLEATPKPATVKIALFCRPNYPEIEDMFRRSPHLLIDQGMNERDIQKFVAKEFFEDFDDSVIDNSFRDALSQISDKANGMFLWVSLLADSLKDCRTIKQLIEGLATLPTGLNDIYTLAMSRIAKSSATDRNLAFNLLFWLANANTQLSREELLTAIVVKPGLRTLESGDKIRVAKGLTKICADLITINSKGDFELIHASLRDYLLNLPNDGNDPLNEYCELQKTAQERLAQVCLTYLLFDNFASGPVRSKDEYDDLVEKNSLLEYAACNWGKHLQQSQSNEFDELALKLLSRDGAKELCAQMIAKPMKKPKYVFSYRGNSNALHQLAQFGLIQIANKLNNIWQLVKEQDAFGQIPLDHALRNKQREMCLWLLGYVSASDRPEMLSKAAHLHWATFLDWPDLAQCLIELGYGLETFNVADETPLIEACKRRSVNVAKVLLAYGSDPEATDSSGRTPLYFASEDNCEVLVRILLEQGARPNGPGQSSFPPLLEAIINDNAEIADLLLQYGADPNFCFFEGHKTPLGIVAARHGAVNAIRPLYARGTNLQVLSPPEMASTYPLHIAALRNHPKFIEVLLELDKTLDVNLQNTIGATPLMCAVLSERPESLRALLAHGGSVNTPMSLGQTPLHEAVRYGYLEIAKILLEHGALVSTPDLGGNTALHVAAEGGNVNFIDILIQGDVDLNMTNVRGRTMLHCAAKLGNVSFTKELIRKFPALSLDTTDDGGETPLMIAAYNGRLEMLKFLLDSKVDLNATSLSGATALFMAIEYNQTPIIVELLDRGAETSTTISGQTLLHSAALAGNATAVGRLLDLGFDASEATSNGKTPLMLAAASGNVEIFNTLLNKDVSAIHNRDNYGNSCLHFAAESRTVEPLLILLSLDVDVHATNNSSQSPLWNAAREGNLENFRRLQEAGLNSQKPGGDITGAVNQAIKQGFFAIVKEAVTRDPGLDLNLDLDLVDASTSVALASLLRIPTIVSLLIEKGTNPFSRDAIGFTALDLAWYHPSTWEAMGFAGKFRRLISSADHISYVRFSVKKLMDEFFALSYLYSPNEEDRSTSSGYRSVSSSPCSEQHTESAISPTIPGLDSEPSAVVNDNSPHLEEGNATEEYRSEEDDSHSEEVDSEEETDYRSALKLDLVSRVRRKQRILRSVGHAMLFCEQASGIQYAKVILLDLFVSRWSCMSFLCQICGAQCSRSNCFACFQCPGLYTCGDCFDSLQKTKQLRLSLRSIIEELQEYETKLIGFKTILIPLISRGIAPAAIPFKLYPPLRYWLLQKFSAFWELQNSLEVCTETAHFDHWEGGHQVTALTDCLEYIKKSNGGYQGDTEDSTNNLEWDIERWIRFDILSSDIHAPLLEFRSKFKNLERDTIRHPRNYCCAEHDHLALLKSEAERLEHDPEIYAGVAEFQVSWLRSLLEYVSKDAEHDKKIYDQILDSDLQAWEEWQTWRKAQEEEQNAHGQHEGRRDEQQEVGDIQWRAVQDQEEGQFDGSMDEEAGFGLLTNDEEIRISEQKPNERDNWDSDSMSVSSEEDETRKWTLEEVMENIEAIDHEVFRLIGKVTIELAQVLGVGSALGAGRAVLKKWDERPESMQ